MLNISLCNLGVDWSFESLLSHIKATCVSKDGSWALQATAAVHKYDLADILAASLETHWEVDKTTNSSFIAIVHERWHCRVHKEYHEVSWWNTLTCQWCALVTLSAGFVSVDGFSNKPLADPATRPPSNAKNQRNAWVSNYGQHLFFVFLLLHTSSLPIPSICGTLGKPQLLLRCWNVLRNHNSALRL